MYYIFQIRNILEGMKNERKIILKELKSLPPGYLYYQVANGKRTFSMSVPEGKDEDNEGPSESNSSVYLSKQPETVIKMARKEYLVKRLNLLDNDIKVVSSILSRWKPLDFDSIMDALPKRLRNIPREKFREALLQDVNVPNPVRARDCPILPLKTAFDGDSITEWGSAPYRENTFHLENKIHKGANGLMYRSKSEVIIAAIYDKNHIQYHYDELFSVGNELISPDFVSINNCGEFIYHEHLGLINDSEYIRGSIEKLEKYARGGIFPGMNLFFTCDNPDGSIDIMKIESLIKLNRRISPRPIH